MIRNHPVASATLIAAAAVGLLAARHEAANSSLLSLISFSPVAEVAQASRGPAPLAKSRQASMSKAAQDATDSFEVLHSFGPEAGDSEAPLLQGSDGKLYGTARRGGVTGQGSVFTLTPVGTGGFTFANLHSFIRSDGATPYAGLIQATDGDFYGTTSSGGANGYGTVFKIDAAGNLTPLHSFASSDGANPYAGLIQASDGDFYGTTNLGGSGGRGTVFKMDSAGNLTTLHAFNNSDGANPYANLIQGSDGNFYGVTSLGGIGYGTVFRMDAAGNLVTLHDFGYYGDGAGPYAALVQATDGNFYGTTVQGGSTVYGTIFRIDASGNFATMHDFVVSDGANPQSTLIQGADGNLYGTAGGGGPAARAMAEPCSRWTRLAMS